MVNYKSKSKGKNKNKNSQKFNSKSSIPNSSNKKNEITKVKLKNMLAKQGIPKPIDLPNETTRRKYNSEIIPPTTPSSASISNKVKQTIKTKHSKQNGKDKGKNTTQKTPGNLNISSSSLSTNPNAVHIKSNGKQTNVPIKSTTPHIAKSNPTISKSKAIKKIKNVEKIEKIPVTLKVTKANQQFNDKPKKNKCKKPSFVEEELPPIKLNSALNSEEDVKTKIKLKSKKTTKNKPESPVVNKKRKLSSQHNLQIKKKKKITPITTENDDDIQDEHSNSESDSYIDQFFDDVAENNGWGEEEEENEQDNLSDEEIGSDDDIFDEESLLNDDLNPQEFEDDTEESIKSNSDDLDEGSISQNDDDAEDWSDEGSYQEYSAEEVVSDENKPIEWSTSDSDDNYVNANEPSMGNGLELIQFNPEEQNDNDLLEYIEEEEEEEEEVESDYFDDSYDNSDGSFDDNDNWSSAVSSEDVDDEDDDDDDDFNEFDSELDSDDDDFDSDDITYNDFMDGQYETNSSDEDYEEEKKYVYVERGQARTYGLDGEQVSFNSEEDGQIIEIPNNDNDNDSVSSCPQLVPIDDSSLLNETQLNNNETTLSAFETTPKTTIKQRKTNLTTHTIVNAEKIQWEKCPIAILNTVESNEMNNVSIDNIMLNMSSKNIVATTQTPKVPTNSTNDSSSIKSDEDESDLEFNNISNIEKIDDDIEVDNGGQDEFDDNTENVSIISGDVDNNEELNDENVGSVASEDEWLEKELSFKKNTQVEQYLIKTRFFNSLNSRQVLVLLKSPLHFHGSLRATLIAGHAQIYGYDLELNKPIVAYSVRGHSFIYFTPLPTIISEENIKNIEQQLDSLRSEFLHTDLVNVIKSFNTNNDALLLFERNSMNTSSIRMINTYMRQNIFPHIYSMDPSRTNYSTELILHCEFFSKPKLSLTTNSEWVSMTQNMKSTTRCMVAGGKGVGKSTYVRYLINSNLHKYKRILLIDLDIGQPELFLPQTVSATLLTEPIIGAGYLQNKRPDRAYLFGEINVVVSPIKYLKCALKLIEYCKENKEYKDCPWIINTMGYVRGFGLELSLAVIKAIGITDLVQIKGRREQDNFDRILDYECLKSFNFNIFHNEMQEYTKATDYQIHVYRSISAAASKAVLNHQSWNITPKDLRFATILSNLGNMLNTSAEWITDVKPVCASLDKLSIIVSSDDKVPTDLHSKLINANLVYLCSGGDDNPTDNIVECYGIGIVRGVDNVTNNVYLLPAISRESLSKVTILAVCGIPLPTSVLLNIKDETDGTVPYVYNTDDFVGSRQVFQITHRPDRSFSRGKRNYSRGGKK